MIWFWVVRLLFIVGVATVFYWLYKNHIADSELKDALRSAKMYDGKLSLIDLATDMDISIDRARRIMSKLVKLGLATIDLDEIGDEIIYKVPRAMPKERPAAAAVDSLLDEDHLAYQESRRDLG